MKLNHKCCWHDAYDTRKVNGVIRQSEACCWHENETRESHLRVVTVKHGKHGQYVPVRK